MSNIVLKDKNGNKTAYYGKNLIKIPNGSGGFSSFISEPTNKIEITENGSYNVKNYAKANVNVQGPKITTYNGEVEVV